MLAYPELAAIRLGHGLSPLSDPPPDPRALVQSVQTAGPDGDAISMSLHHLPVRSRYASLSRSDAPDREARMQAVRIEARDLGRHARRIRFARAVGDAGGFGERLVQFWADHFTVTNGSLFETVAAAAFVDEAIRPHLTGRFADMMVAAETHPRMVVYLDQVNAIGPRSAAARRSPDKRLGANENLAREMIELHSLGAGSAYQQRDVRQLALLLTGLSFRPDQDAAVVFNPNRAEPGPFTVLGKTYERGEGDHAIHRVIADLAVHDATARHVAVKLAVHFVSDDPPEALVTRLAEAFRGTGGDLPTLYGVLAEAPELRDCFRHKVRQPFDHIVASLRGCGFGRADIMAMEERDFSNLVMQGMVMMGQKWGSPRGPDGWPEDGAAWITPQGVAGRVDWAVRMLPKLGRDLPDPRVFLQTALGDSASDTLRRAVPRAESPVEGLALILASPDFNRR